MEGIVPLDFELQADITELTSLLNQAQRPKVKLLLEKNISELGKELEKLKKQKDVAPMDIKESPKESPGVILKKEPMVISKDATTVSSYYWEQDSKFVKVYVELDGIGDVPKEEISVTFKSDSFEMFCWVKSKQYRFSLSNLAHPIEPSGSLYRTKAGGKRIIFNLKKTDSKHWDSIFKKEDKFKKPKFDEQDPNKGIMDLMKNMYEEGDEDMKRTIAKAWTESRDKTSKGSKDPMKDF